MKKMPRILTVNPGSTTTKLGYFQGTEAVEIQQIDHLKNPLWNSMTENEQFEERLRATEKFIAGKSLDLVMARGGILKPLSSGVYIINDKMLEDLKNAPMKHASNLAAPIAKIIADKRHIPGYIADPVTVDELQEIARYSGHPFFPRKSIFHALNQKAVARKYAETISKKYEDLNLIVIHMGGGISIGAHRHGLVIDVNQALDGEGPFSPERSGTLPAGDLVRAAFSGKFSENEMLKMITGNGGLKAYLGTADVKRLLENKDKETMKIIDAMIYQIAKYAGEMAVVLQGKIDAVIFTGGLAHAGYIIRQLTGYLSFLNSDFAVFPGENELEALAFNGLLAWKGKIKTKKYR